MLDLDKMLKKANDIIKNNISKKITSSDELTNNLIDDLENPSKETKSKSVKIKEIGHQTLNDTETRK